MNGLSADRPELTQCEPSAGQCTLYAPGHLMHCIHANHLARDARGWRDGIVTAMDSGWIVISYISEEGSVSVWHHKSLSADLQIGSPVRVHEGLHALGIPSGWSNMAIAGGLGAVAESARDAPDESVGRGVVDVVTGRAIALDHFIRHD
jgi:hypothetical protein